MNSLDDFILFDGIWVQTNESCDMGILTGDVTPQDYTIRDRCSTDYVIEEQFRNPRWWSSKDPPGTQESNAMKWAFVVGGGLGAVFCCLTAYFQLKSGTFVIHEEHEHRRISERLPRKHAPGLYWFHFFKMLFFAVVSLAVAVMAALS